MSLNETYIKCVSISKKRFDSLSENIKSRYEQSNQNVSFTDFEQASFFAFVLGSLSARGDKKSVYLFFHYIKNKSIPIVKVFEDEKNIKISVYMKI